jgi:hypothetical protein
MSQQPDTSPEALQNLEHELRAGNRLYVERDLALRMIGLIERLRERHNEYQELDEAARDFIKGNQSDGYMRLQAWVERRHGM